jgi:hypothetical protein
MAVKQSGRGRGQQGGATARRLIHMPYIKKSFFEVMSEFQKDLEDVSAGMGI